MLSRVKQLGRWSARAARPRLGQAAAALRTTLQPVARDGLAQVLSRVGATRPRRFARGALTVVTFHRVLPADKLREYPLSGLAVTPEQLQQIAGELAEHFVCLPLSEAYRRWQSEPNAQRPTAAITFDDGSLDNYEHARPVLAQLSLQASFYIPVGLVEQRVCPWHDRLGFALLRSVAAVRKQPKTNFPLLLAPFGLTPEELDAILPVDALLLAARGVSTAKQLSPGARERAIVALEQALGDHQVPGWAGLMSWQQIRELAAQGHEIGSHSLTHPLLPDLDAAEIEREVQLSRTLLAEAAGCQVTSFCYPNGSYDQRSLEAVSRAGYSCAVTTRWGLHRGGSPFEIERCDMDFARLLTRQGEFSPERLWLRLSGLQPGLTSTTYGD